MKNFQVRGKVNTSKPENRGVLIAEFETYQQAYLRCQQEQERGDKTAFVSKIISTIRIQNHDALYA